MTILLGLLALSGLRDKVLFLAARGEVYGALAVCFLFAGADIVIAAAGVPGIITGDMVKPGAALLDVGVSRVDGKIAGDVAADVVDVAGFVAPNPGGVGPMTRAMLLQNVVLAAEQAAQRRKERLVLLGVLAGVLVLIVLCANLIGDALRDALDPKDR